MNIPQHTLGADLFWWRETANLHTLVTIFGGVYHLAPDELILTFHLHDQDGQVQAIWEQPITPDGFAVIDSRRLADYCSTAKLIPEGVLAAYVSTREQPSPELSDAYSRLFSVIDWFSDDGDLCTLHNDQSSLVDNEQAIEFTEIVFEETVEEKNYLVILNGLKPQKKNAIEIQIRNHHSEVQKATYVPAMQPFTVHKLNIADLFPDIVALCDGHHVTASGNFDAMGLFTRPYVITEGKRLCAYHGGDRYDWDGLPQIAYRFMGRGEVNPMMALHSRDVTTTVNILNTHGDLEQDYWIDARLYNEKGQMVAEREQWLLAKRNELSRGNIEELLSDPNSKFVGHLAMNFSYTAKVEFYPQRLQALMEYRTPVNTSRVMAWSDCWNAPARRLELEENDVTLRSYFRAWYSPTIVTYLSITNCGVSPNYDADLPYHLRVFNQNGESLSYEGLLAPQGTDYFPLEEIFPSIGEFLGDSPIGMTVIDSEGDLAIVQVSHHNASNVYSAEHFMSAETFHNGKSYLPAGS